MLTVVLIILALAISVLAVYLINKYLSPKLKPVIIAVFWVLAIIFGYQIYQSINLPIKFDKIKKERYAEVIKKLKDIRDAQDAYRTINGEFANDFKSLITFVDTAQFVLTQQRDSSFLEYSEVYKIEELKEIIVIDTLGFRAVKDSLFGASDHYKTLADVPFAKNNEKFQIVSDVLDKNGYKAAVFEAKVKKSIVLWDQPKDLLAQENEQISVDEVNGSEIIVGSLSDVTTNGNWPQSYDLKKNN